MDGTWKLYVLCTATSITYFSVPSNPWDAVFIRNGSVIIVSIEETSQLTFYKVNSPTSYILAFTLSAPNTPYTLHRVNETLLYVATTSANTPIYTLTYNSPTTSWLWYPYILFQ
jgi:hypothetical protein